MTDPWTPPRSARTADGASRPHGPMRWQHRVLHVLVVAAGWCLFFGFWVLVIGRPHDARYLRLLVLGAVVVVPVLTLGWVLHNVGIYHRKGPRRAVPDVDQAYRVDFNGRRIVADWQMLDRMRHIEIGVAGDLKFYRFARTDLPADAVTVRRAESQDRRPTRPAELIE